MDEPTEGDLYFDCPRHLREILGSLATGTRIVTGENVFTRLVGSWWIAQQGHVVTVDTLTATLPNGAAVEITNKGHVTHYHFSGE